MSYWDEVISDSPVALWKLDEASGTLVDTQVGNDGTASGSPTYQAAGPDATGIPYALTFDGTTYVDVPDSTDVDLGDGPFTIEFWLKRTSVSALQTVLDKGQTGASSLLVMFSSDNFIRLARSDDSTPIVRSSVAISDTNWHHYAFTKNGGAAHLYVDGVANEALTNPTLVIGNSTDSFRIGREPGSSGVVGSMAGVALYKTVLSASRVAAHYAARSTGGGTFTRVDGIFLTEGSTTLTTPAETITLADASLAGTPPAPQVLAATTGAASGTSAALTTVIATKGVAAAVATVVAALSTGIPLVGSVTAAAVANASTLTGGAAAQALAGSVAGLSTVRGVLLVTPPNGLTGSATYVVEILDSSPTFGPGAKLGELWDLRNLGWSAYDRIPGKAFFTLSQLSDSLSLIEPLVTHIRIWRLTPQLTTLVFVGAIIDYDSSGDDVVVNAFDYKALLSISRSGYRTLYPTKAIGTEIVSPEWALAKGALSSPLGFVATGAIEDPLGTDGVTVIKTNTQFGLLDQMRLQLFFDLSEIGRANTVNHTTFEITRSLTPTFEFRKDKGVNVDLGLVLNGNVSDYRHLPNWTSYRNDLATIGTTVGGGATELVVKDDAAAAAKGRRQDVFTIKTLLGIAGAATTADQQQAASQRMLKSALELQPTLQLRLLRNSLDFFDGWDLSDKPIVEISNGIDSIAERWRILGARATFDEAGEAPSLIVAPVAI